MEQNPEVEIKTMSPSWNGTDEIYEMLKNQKIDLFFGEENKYCETTYNCAFLPLSQDHLSVLMSFQHPLCSHTSISIEELQKYEITSYKQESPRYRLTPILS